MASTSQPTAQPAAHPGATVQTANPAVPGHPSGTSANPAVPSRPGAHTVNPAVPSRPEHPGRQPGRAVHPGQRRRLGRVVNHVVNLAVSRVAEMMGRRSDVPAASEGTGDRSPRCPPTSKGRLLILTRRPRTRRRQNVRMAISAGAPSSSSISGSSRLSVSEAPAMSSDVQYSPT